MTLALTPAILQAAYSYFLLTAPFRGWRLPPVGEIKFAVTSHQDRRADCWDKQEQIGIRVSRQYVGHTHSLMAVMGHELIHVRQFYHKLDTPNTKHNAAFYKDALLVCRYHGFDPKAFV